MKLVVWHLEPVERLNRENIEPCSAIDESLGDGHVADDGGAEHGECASGGRVLEPVRGVEGDGTLGPLERASHLKLGGRRIDLARRLLEETVRSWGL